MRQPSRSEAGLAGGLLALVAVGAGIGLAAERRVVGRTRRRPDPEAREPFFRLPADRTLTVTADDGVPLHVEEVGPAAGEQGARLTVVFCHGYTQQMAVWHYQRQALAADNPGRLVFWDQRAHGRSGRGRPENSTIDQLGRDLHAVLDEVDAGDEVLLFGPGDDGEPTAQDWADLLGTIDYEIVTRIGARVPRVHR